MLQSFVWLFTGVLRSYIISLDIYLVVIIIKMAFIETGNAMENNNMPNDKKRWVIEWLIKSSKDLDAVWDVVNRADEMGYSLTENQKKTIISKLVHLSSSKKEMRKIEKYAKSNGLWMHYVMLSTGKGIGETIF